VRKTKLTTPDGRFKGGMYVLVTSFEVIGCQQRLGYIYESGGGRRGGEEPIRPVRKNFQNGTQQRTEKHIGCTSGYRSPPRLIAGQRVVEGGEIR